MDICKLCDGVLLPFGHGNVLGDRRVLYQRCAECGSICLCDPDWLEEAYSSAISALDVGLLERCQQLANVTTAVLTGERLFRGSFLDFGGGYGTLTRLMRDRGFAFHNYDPLCESLFAQGLDGKLGVRYDLVTAFEVLEHLVDPVAALHSVAETTDLLLVTTQVVPNPPPRPGTWTYYAEDSGQHVTFYTVAGLHSLAAAFGMQLMTAGKLVHLFHRRPIRLSTRMLLIDERLAYAVGALRSEHRRRRGLTAADSQKAAMLLRQVRQQPPR